VTEPHFPLFACPKCGDGIPSACPRCKTSFTEMTRPWSAREVAQFAGVSDRTVQHWRKSGVTGPSQPFPPVEPDRVYSFQDAVSHKMLDDLLKARVPREIAIEAADDITQFVGRCMLDYVPEDDEDEESWAKRRWVIVPLTRAALEEVSRPKGQFALISYGEQWEPPGLPSAAELNERLRPGQWVVPIDDRRVAYPLVLAVEEVAERIDAYVRSHHIKAGELWDFQVG
jgi:hypothetical protein